MPPRHKTSIWWGNVFPPSHELHPRFQPMKPRALALGTSLYTLPLYGVPWSTTVIPRP